MNVGEMYHKIASSIRVLSVDAIQKAKSGHPGMPLGMADIAAVFLVDFFNFVPNWINRDRLILSNGHGSMLLYSMLYLMGYLDIEDLKQFRQLSSITPGHPEFGVTPCVEMSTGPLGQGIGSAVGFAISERMLHARFGDVIDHYTYVFAGDGCLMEGISHEACSLAGHLKLNKLIVIFDDNGISIDGSISITSSDNVKMRFSSYNWNVIEADGHDFAEIKKAFSAARNSDRPTLICFKTVIGRAVLSREGKSAAHSGPFKNEEIASMKHSISWSMDEFFVPDDVLQFVTTIVENTKNVESSWKQKAIATGKYDEICKFFRMEISDGVIQSLHATKQDLFRDAPSQATRVSFLNILKATNLPNLIGGSADLTASNGTKHDSLSAITSGDFSGSYIHYGIREHGMAACMNGMALYGCFLPYGGTFLVFSDYLRPSVRLAALMKLHVIYVLTHDSIGVGEDGPTHQPVEHIASFRIMPGVYLFRPADAIEVLECWELALKIKAPIMMILSRQTLDCIPREYSAENRCSHGAYILHDSNKTPDVTLIATGSEVNLAMTVSKNLSSVGVNVRVISFPSFELFECQDQAYKDNLFQNNSLKVVIEAGVSFGWDRYVGGNCKYFCVDDFGLSAKSEDVYKHFGLTADNICKSIEAHLLEKK